VTKRKNRRRTPTQGRAKATVQAILQATAQVLQAQGYDRASTNRIARRAGVSVGSLYQYFPNKQAIVEALAEEHLQRLLRIATQDLVDTSTLTIAELTRRVARGLVAAHRAEPDLHRVLASIAPVDVVQRFRRLAEHALAADMARRRASGENRVHDPEISAFLVVTLLDEAVRTAVLHRPTLLDDDRLIDALTDMTCRYVLPVSSLDGPERGPLPRQPPRQGAIHLLDPRVVQPHVPGVPHPHVIVQDDVLNASRLPTVAVCGLTTRLKLAGQPGNLLLDVGDGGLPQQSVVLGSQVSVVDKRDLGPPLGHLTSEQIDAVLERMRSLGRLTER